MKRPVRPRDAAAMILLDGKGAKTRILLGRRNPAVKFMPNRFVFPGGRLEPGDRRMTVAGALDARVEARLLKGRASDDPTFARALALAAIRETFEETGVVIGTPEFGGPQKAPAGWGAYAEQGCLPDLQEMHFICRAITPPSLPKRFDTRFFALNAKAIARQIDGYAHADAELVELAWVRLDKAEDYDLPAITRQVLTELRLRLASGMSFYAPTPFFRQIRNVWRREEL